MNTFKYLLLGTLFLASCSEQVEFKRPGETGGETVEVTTDIQVAVLPMQSIGSPATRSEGGIKPEKGEAIRVTYGSGNATTRVQTGTDPMTEAESKINNAYIVQFNGTDPTSTAAWVSSDIKNRLGSGSPITCSFSMASGKKNRVYVIANRASAPTQGMTLADFEKPVPFAPATSVPSIGLPMSAMQDIGVGDVFEVFRLKSLLAKVKFQYSPSGGGMVFKGFPSGYTFFTQARPGDNAVRPSGMTYKDVGFISGYWYYIPENMSGRNNELVQHVTRCARFAPENAMYIELTASGNTVYNLYLGDGSAQDFNFTGGYAYDIHATIYGKDPYDLRVGNTLPAGTPITDLNAQAGGKTANCYIVGGASKWYTFNSTVMGNGATTPAYGAPDAADIIPSKLNPASADVLWETVNTSTAPAKGAIVNNNLYFLKDRILFKSGSTEGNAVIAARDASKKIIWSWHIWRIDDTPSGILLKDITDGKGFTVSGIKMMDRNLGALAQATSATNASLGFLYQWGRKDPFMGPASTGANYYTKATNVDFTQNMYPESTLEAAIASPTSFYIGTDWLTLPNANLWGGVYSGNKVTIGSTIYDSNRGSKTIYDPCPPGWRIPPQYVFANAIGTISGFNAGFDFKGKLTASTSLFLPAVGFRMNSTEGAKPYGNGFRGDYWTASQSSNFGAGISMNDSQVKLGVGNRSYGFSVRCVQEY